MNKTRQMKSYKMHLLAKKKSWVLLSVLTTLLGCSNDIQDKEFHGKPNDLYAENQRITGFEDHNDWRNSNANSPVHTEGISSVEVTAGNRTVVESVPLSSLGAVSNSVSIDVYLPEIPNWGNVTMVVKIPSAGLYYQQLEAVPLNTLNAGNFSTVSFALPSNVKAALSGTYNDLTFSVIFNTEAMSAPILVDNLNIGQSSGGTGVAGGVSITGVSSSDFIFSLPLAVPLETACLTTNDWMRIADGIVINSFKANITNLGEGEINAGADSYLGGNIYAMGDLTLRDRAAVQGFAHVNGTVHKENSADAGHVVGGVKNVKVKHGKVFDWTIYWPISSEEVFLDADAPPEAITPGAYRSLRVQPRATAIFSAGTYYFDSVNIEADANIVLDSNGGAVIFYVKESLTSRGEYSYTTSAADFFIGYAGNTMANLDSSFGGTVVAPNATIRLAPLNGLKHSGSFFAKSIDAEARTEIEFIPFNHWQSVFDSDMCVSPTTSHDCTNIPSWELGEYQENGLVQDGMLVYEAHSAIIAGANEDYQPGVGAQWRFAWHQAGVCSNAADVQEFLTNFNKDDIFLFYPFNKISTDESGAVFQDINGVNAALDGEDIYVNKHAGRKSCETYSAMAINTNYEEIVENNHGADYSLINIDKLSDSKSLSIFFDVNPLEDSSHAFVSHLSVSGSVFSFGYSTQSGFYVDLGTQGGSVSTGLDNGEPLQAGAWTELGVVVEDMGNGTSLVQIVKDGDLLLGDTSNGMLVNGELDLENGLWLVGAYQDNILGDIHTAFEGQMGPMLFLKKGVNPVLAQAYYSMAMNYNSLSNNASTTGTEAGVNTGAPNLPSPNPMSHIRNIAPPSANTRGSANVTYPIDVPKAFVGMTPNVSLDYSSEQKNGNAGIGWQLSHSAITIDTSDKGVPKYRSYEPIENLLIDGRKLVYWKTVAENRLYRLMKESGFIVVSEIQHPIEIPNNAISAYSTFVVYFPDGRQAEYGNCSSCRLMDPAMPTHNSTWYLNKMVDPNGNEMVYTFDNEELTDSEMVRVPRLSKIEYGQGYRVDFEWEDKSNYQVSGRSGFLVRDDNRLVSIEVFHDQAGKLNSYELEYSDAEILGKILSAIRAYSGSGNLTNHHEFAYTELGREYPVDGPEDGNSLGENNLYFKSAEPAIFPAEYYSSRKTIISMRSGEYIATEMTHTPMDWNGDGIQDFLDIDLPVSFSFSGPGYATISPGEYPWANGTDFTAIPVEDFTDKWNDGWPNWPECIYPINWVDSELFDYACAIDPSFSNTYIDGPAGDSGWRFKRSGLYDFNGDGTKDIVYSCNDKLVVVVNDAGQVDPNNFQIVSFPHISDSLINLSDYSWYNEGRTIDNLYIEHSSLELARTIWNGDATYNRRNYGHSKLIDMNGDGWLDRLFSATAGTSCPGNSTTLHVQYNQGPGVGISPTNEKSYFASPICGLELTKSKEGQDGIADFSSSCEQQRIMDINGDGLPDVVSIPYWGEARLQVRLNSGKYATEIKDFTNFPVFPQDDDLRCLSASTSTEDWPNFVAPRGDDDNDIVYETAKLMDINGDGLPDAIQASEDGLLVALNIGNGFQNAQIWTDVSYPYLGYNKSWRVGSVAGPELQYYGNRNEQFIQDCSGDGIPDILVPSSDGTQRFCRENVSGEVNRLRKIENKISGEKYVLKYDNKYPVHDNADSVNGYRVRPVLAAVEITNTMVSDSPLEKRVYNYSSGAQEDAQNRFIGWEEVASKTYPSSNDDLYYFTNEEFDFSSTDGWDEWGINRIPDDYLNGSRLLKQEGHGNSNGEFLLNQTAFEYEAVEILADQNKVKYVYPNKISKSVFDLDGNCLHGVAGDGSCKNQVVQNIIVEFDTNKGIISQRKIESAGDTLVDYDDQVVIESYFSVADSYRNYLSTTETLHNGIRLNLVEYEYENGDVSTITKWSESNASLQTAFTYYNNGLVKTMTGPNGVVTQFTHEYPVNDNIAYQASLTKTNGTQILQQFDYKNRLLLKSTNSGEWESFVYDDFGRLIGTGNHIAGGDIATFEYFESLSEGTRYYGVETQGLQTTGEPIYIQRLVDAAGKKAQTKLRRAVDGETQWVISGNISYDSDGRIAAIGKNTVQENSGGKLFVNNDMIEPTSVTYGDLGEIVRIDFSDGTFEQIARDIVSSWSQNIAGQTYTKNQTMFMEQTTNNVGQVSNVYNDIYGNVVASMNTGENGEQQVSAVNFTSPLEMSVIDPLGRISTTKVDSLGREEWIDTPDAGKVEYVYNALGQLSTVVRHGKNETDNIWDETQILYDSNGRRQFIDYAGEGRDVAIEYYSSGAPQWNQGKIQSTSVGTFQNGTVELTELLTEYEYDIDSVLKTRTLTTQDATGNQSASQASMQYFVDSFGRTTQVVYPDTEVVNYSYDIGGYLTGIAGDRPYVSRIDYNEFGQRTLVENGNGVVTEYEYDEATELLSHMSVTNTAALPGSSLLNLSYQYNAKQMIRSIESQNGYNLSYEYDGLNRLSSATGVASDSSWSHTNSYTFDNANRLNETSTNTANSDFSFWQNSNAPEVVVKAATNGSGNIITNTYTYNDFGQMAGLETQDADVGTSSRQFAFNADGTLGAITGTDLDMTFKYDEAQNRVYKKSTGTDGTGDETFYLFSLFTEKNEVISNQISDGKFVVATKINGDENKVIYPVANNLGSTIMTTNDEAHVLSEAVYDPFGNDWSTAAEGAEQESERQFANQIYDTETGLYYFNMRYYDPQLGAFISPDPALSGINHYVYASGDPINRIDPTGLDDWIDGGGGYWDPVCTDAECSGAGGTAGGGGGGSADDTTTGNENPDACVYGKSCRPERSPSKPSPPNPWKTGHASPGISYSDVMGSPNDIAFNIDTFFDFFTAGDQYIEDEVKSAVGDLMVFLGMGDKHLEWKHYTYIKPEIHGGKYHIHWDESSNPRANHNKIRCSDGKLKGPDRPSKKFIKFLKGKYAKYFKVFIFSINPEFYFQQEKANKQILQQYN